MIDPRNEFHKKLCRWLVANGLDPNKIPFYPGAVAQSGNIIVVDELVFDEKGVPQYEELTHEFLRISRTVPIVVKWEEFELKEITEHPHR